MTPAIMRILKKVYCYDNRLYDKNNGVSYSENVLTEKEKALLKEYGWKTNDTEKFQSHDDIIAKVEDFKEHSNLTKEQCLNAFISGVGGSYPRGNSVLAAWYYLFNCPVHTYTEKEELFRCCWVCECEDTQQTFHVSKSQYYWYLGNSYTSNPLYAYFNLKHLESKMSEIPIPTKDDILVLITVLDLLRNAPENETPGKFEKRLSEAKIIKGDRNIKRGILDSLALVGVIPNQFIPLSDTSFTNFGDIAIYEEQLKNTQGRSDMKMPWAGWLGSLKINEIHTQELFKDYFEMLI